MRARTIGVDVRAGDKTLLDDVGMRAHPGSTVGLLGPNGSGKSTLLRTLAGLARPSRGQVLLDGVDRSAWSGRSLARRVAVVAQHSPSDVDMSALEVLLLGRIPHRSLLAPPGPADEEKALAALAGWGLAGAEHRRWASLSGGERQRVAIARAMLQEPDLLLLDEPTNHLDVRHRYELMDRLAASPATVVVALHELDLAARYCDHIVLLDHGRVVASGPPADVLTPAQIAETFGVAADTGTDDSGRRYLRLYAADR